MPEKIGPYAILGEIGRGGMGVVYRGIRVRDDGTSKSVAIKVVLPYVTGMPGWRELFLREIRLAASVRHENIVAVLDSGEFEEGLFLVTEYVEGCTLFSILRAAHKRARVIPVRVAFAIVASLLRALDAVHSARDTTGRHLEMVHRDVSPQNILVGRDGIVRLADFGLARAYAEAALSNVHAVKGKIAYIAPEQFAGETTVQSDVYSAGVVLWELLTAKPYRGKPRATELASAVMRDPVPPSTHRSDLPPGADALAVRSLATEPALRFSSASAMLEALEGIVAAASAEEIATLGSLIE